MHSEPQDHTLMRCCGKLVMAELKDSYGSAWAWWRCPLCGEIAQQPLGEINASKAKIGCEEEPPDDYPDDPEGHVCDDDCRSCGCKHRNDDYLYGTDDCPTLAAGHPDCPF